MLLVLLFFISFYCECLCLFMLQVFSNQYCVCNPNILRHFRSPDTVFLLAFAVMMLNTDLHNKNVRADKKMKVEDFIRNLRGTTRLLLMYVTSRTFEH